jgi:hypothetical protein
MSQENLLGSFFVQTDFPHKGNVLFQKGDGIMWKRTVLTAVAVGLIWIGSCAPSYASVQKSVGDADIFGEWDMEVDAGGEYFYLSFSIERSGEGIEGTISESSGFFSDVPLENIEFDGTKLSFEMNIPTPPDGYENKVKSILQLIEGKFEGTLSVESLGVSAAARASKKT